MSSRLPRVRPYEAGVDASGVHDFLDALANLELHSFMLVRSGKVVAQSWWAPYQEDDLALGYSLSKSVTGIALSFALDDQLVSLDDKVIDVLGERSPSIDNATRAITVRDLARMTTGHHIDPLLMRPWTPPSSRPGGVWMYNNWASYTLAKVIATVTDMSLSDYLEARLFEPLDIDEWAWTRKDGVEYGCSGLHLRTESWAKIGHLLLRKGKMFGRSVVSESFIAEATSRQADTSVHVDGRPRTESGPDWKQGYGYQFWISRHGFRGDGMYGQFLCVLPDQDAVLVTTARTTELQTILQAAWDHLLPAFDNAKDPALDDALAARLARAQLAPLASRAPDQAATFRASGKPGALNRLTQISAAAQEDAWQLSLWLDGTVVTLQAGDARWIRGELPGVGGLVVPLGASAGWVDDTTFALWLQSTQTPHKIAIVCDLESGTFDTHWHGTPLHTNQFDELAIPFDVWHRQRP